MGTGYCTSVGKARNAIGWANRGLSPKCASLFCCQLSLLKYLGQTNLLIIYTRISSKSAHQQCTVSISLLKKDSFTWSGAFIIFIYLFWNIYTYITIRNVIHICSYLQSEIYYKQVSFLGHLTSIYQIGTVELYFNKQFNWPVQLN